MLDATFTSSVNIAAMGPWSPGNPRRDRRRTSLDRPPTSNGKGAPQPSIVSLLYSYSQANYIVRIRKHSTTTHTHPPPHTYSFTNGTHLQ